MAKNAKLYQTITEKMRVSTIWACINARLMTPMPALTDQSDAPLVLDVA